MNTDYYCNNLINSFTKLIFGASYWFYRLMLQILGCNCLKYRYLLRLGSCKIVTSGYQPVFRARARANV